MLSTSVQLVLPLDVRHVADHTLVLPVVHGFHALQRLTVYTAAVLYQARRVEKVSGAEAKTVRKRKCTL